METVKNYLLSLTFEEQLKIIKHYKREDTIPDVFFSIEQLITSLTALKSSKDKVTKLSEAMKTISKYGKRINFDEPFYYNVRNNYVRQATYRDWHIGDFIRSFRYKNLPSIDDFKKVLMEEPTFIHK